MTESIPAPEHNFPVHQVQHVHALHGKRHHMLSSDQLSKADMILFMRNFTKTLVSQIHQDNKDWARAEHQLKKSE